ARVLGLSKEAGLPVSFVFHDLRHTHATQFLDAGGDMKVLQKRPALSTFGTTANPYSHVLQNAQAEAVSKLVGKTSRQSGVTGGRQKRKRAAGTLV
ncbi:MAG: tyrosine-type recombinase/integrase, partial [Planctomycetaceae bacterium]|nr:tyrosine-type recombinase/integrase [Planctomycetaceae bacterium]